MLHFLLIVLLSLSSAAFSSKLAENQRNALVRLVDSPGLTDYEQACALQLLAVRAENRPFETAIEDAHFRFPHCPRERAFFLRQQLSERGGNRIVPVDEEGRPAFLDSRYDRGISVEFSTEFNTAIFRTRRWSFQDADVVLLALHGQGGLPSHSRSWFQPAQILSHVVDANLTAPRHTAVELRRLFPDGFRFPKIHVVSVDQPGHGTGPSAHHYMSMDSYLHWLERVIAHVSVPNKPLVIVARSASPPLVRELMARWERGGMPSPIRALIEIGAVYPGRAEREHDLRTFIDEALTANNPIDREVNWPGWVMSRYLELQMTWLPTPPTTVPILTMVGESDGVVSPSARLHFRALSTLNARSQYIEVPGGHDPLFLCNRGRRGGGNYSLKGYEAILRFLNQVL